MSQTSYRFSRPEGARSRKLPTGSQLGASLRSHRRETGLSQADLAAAAELAEKTLRQLEHGRGNLDSWYAVLGQLDLELAGRNLPPGEGLGPELPPPGSPPEPARDG